MTEKASKIFNEVLDLNWDMNREEDVTTKFEIARRLGNKQKELKEEMGDEAYDKFMNNGKKMFAPKQ